MSLEGFGALKLPQKEIKSNLDKIWSELQSNLPEINFDDSDDKVL